MIGTRAYERVVGYPLIKRWLAGEGLPPRLHLIVGLVFPIWVLIVNMYRVHWFTIDDAYISFRYGRNLAEGLGLVYNPGEAIEGYTNFLWTVLIAAGFKLGIDPHITVKVLGAASAIGTLVVVYKLTQRLLPFSTLPCVCTWLLASSAPFSGYAVLGLETNGFTFLLMLGTLMMAKEVENARAFPWSGLVFALAGLTRPEAPMFLGIPMLLLGKRFFARQNLLRGIIFAAPLAAHLLWRHNYYGAWLPATLGAKTGDFWQQYVGGKKYILGWVDHTGPVVFLGFYGAALGIVRRHWLTLSLTAVFAGELGYILLVGGDWMSYFRYLAPGEPYIFLLVCYGARRLVEYRNRAASIALLAFGIYIAYVRVYGVYEAQKKWMKEEKKFWDSAAGQAAEWLHRYAKPGRIAVGDIGYVGYRTNFPILDLLGLVDPVISQLPGGYTRKVGQGYKERFFDVMPEYGVIIMNGQECRVAGLKASKQITDDARFKRAYSVVHNIQVNSDAGWCIFKRNDFAGLK